jgi:hypothetical protein
MKNKITNEEINVNARIEYSKLDLKNKIRNEDIGERIKYSNL